MFFHALFVTDRCPGRHIISNCNAGPTCMNSGIMLTYSGHNSGLVMSSNDIHSYVSESGSRLLAFNSVTQKYGGCNYIMNLDQRCEHKNLKCDKQIKECK
jgi:hypothetical protein